MRTLIGCLAIIGLLVVLTVGGCCALMAYGVWSLPGLPAGATKEAIERRHADTLQEVAACIRKQDCKSLQGNRAVVAVYRSEDLEHTAVYLSDPTLTKGGHHLQNGAGVATMRSAKQEIECVAYELTVADEDYLVFLPAPPLEAASPPR